MKYIIISFFTRETEYENEVQNLIASLKKLNLTYAIYSVPNLGNWCKNAQYKAKVILYALQRYRDYNIVYVDADAIIQQNPILFEIIQEDFACHFKNGKELLSGTLFFKNCTKIYKLVQHWIDENTKHPLVWDQRNLANELKQHTEIVTLNLPPQYTQIFDTMKNCGTPVIEHFQASRRFKARIDNVHQHKV